MSTSVVHAFASLQLVGQLPSHVSPGSITAFPHDGRHALSFVALQPAGQHASALPQAVIAG
jgi:hypothetical protein